MNELYDILSLSVIQNAIIVGLLMTLCAALLGVTLVLRRFSMIGDGLSHVGFGAVAVAMLFNCAPLLISTPIVIVTSFLMMNTKSGKFSGDSSIAMASSASLAVGSIIANYTGNMNYEQYLFGSVFSLSGDDVTASIVICTLVIAVYLLMFNKIFVVTLDESFAKAVGIRVTAVNYISATLIAFTVVIGMRMMGALLMSSLIVFPALSSMKICKTYLRTSILSCIISIISFLFGFMASIILNMPIGASIVVINVFIYILSLIISRILKCGLFKRRINTTSQ